MILKIVLLCCLFFICVAEHEGSSCTQNGVNGTCVLITKCKSALEDIKRRKHPQICSFIQTDPIVCCFDDPSVTEAAPFKPITTAPISSTSSMYIPEEIEIEYHYVDSRVGECGPIPAATANRTGQKAFDKCIEYQEKYVYPCEKGVGILGEKTRKTNCHHNVNELVVGGVDALKNEFPHMGKGLFSCREGMSINYHAQGAGNFRLLSPGFLTMGSSLYFPSPSVRNVQDKLKKVPVTHIVVGVLSRNEINNNIHRYQVKRVIKHPQYNSPFKYHDIALLETAKPVALSQFVVPACLHTGEPVNDTRVLATGWGLLDNRGSTSDILQKVILQKFTIAECEKLYLPHRFLYDGIDPQTQLCYGHREEAKDTCSGDSGGPIQIKSARLHCMYTVVGVTSFGGDCGAIGRPAIYTRVAHYIPWIESIVWP